VRLTSYVADLYGSRWSPGHSHGYISDQGLARVGLQAGMEGSGMLAGKVLEIIEYTDPYCTWCWGSEPILRKIQYMYGDQIVIGYRMGGLVRDIRDFYDPVNAIGGEEWYAQVAAHWEDASRRHGMPVDSRVFYDIRESFTSTYPANIAVKAAELQDRELAKKYLRRLREAAAAERQPIHLMDIQAELALEVGLDGEKLLGDIRSGEAARLFELDLRECRAMGVTGFPTFLVRNLVDGRSALVYGYRRYSYFEGLMDELAGDKLVRREISKDKMTVLDFIRRWGKVATQEVATLLDVSRPEAFRILEDLTGEGLILKVVAGNDYFWKPIQKRSVFACDPEVGICGTL
jgi:putative protein-disulfide isomerase